MAQSARRFLVKVSEKAGSPFKLRSFGLDGRKTTFEPMFDVDVRSSLQGLAPGETHRWYLADLGEEVIEHPWDAAHAQLGQGLGAMGAQIPGLLMVEPDILHEWPPAPAGRMPFAAAGTTEEPSRPKPQYDDERPQGPGRHWHLGEEFTGLKAARRAADGGAGITIAHLDTGYDPNHVTLPANLDRKNQFNYVDEKFQNDAVDRTPEGGLLRNRGHGTFTLGILAGNVVGKDGAGDALGANEPLGGAPNATVIPLRVADSVVRFYSSAIAKGIIYAWAKGAHVLSMSMGGTASAAWAEAVNRVYGEGLVLVTAAGNNFAGFPTRFVVYPARFRRVLAACGVMADGRPYFNLPVQDMQGNHGPDSKMQTAISAYTPNISRARIGSGSIIDLNGEGTSAATPQVAAAAALYYAKYKKQLLAMPDGWRRVEAVRNALFASAKAPAGGNANFETLGRGILRANEALKIAPAATDEQKQPVDDASFSFLKGMFGWGLEQDDPRAAMVRLEMTQLAQHSRAIEETIQDPDVDGRRIPEAQKRRFFEAVIAEPSASRALRNYLGQRLVRRPGVGLPPPEVQPAPMKSGKKGKRGAAVTPPAPSHPPFPLRQAQELVPPARRLRIFAVDPSYGTNLSTAFLNETTVEVPWERSPSHPNLLSPGPVGEYLEVVDVDPASGSAYAPVDLNEPALLAQDGLPPSEGSPQFHQQQVYAVAMRTIRHFENALGRVALWAPRRTSFVQKAKGKKGGKPVYTTSYVQRLRIYPHALLQKNAFYSPEKKALLFGYFPTSASEYSGATSAMVFTCLSHDIVAHETTHALLDGIHPRLQEATNRDVLAFHEAFADVVAIFQHFTLREVLLDEIRQSGGHLELARRLAALAQQFGQSAERSAALRSALGQVGGQKTVLTDELSVPHARGALLLAAIFDAFLAIYRRRSADLFQLANGTMPPELVERLADEAVKSAEHILNICIRALDYLPPVDVTFSDFLRALITADTDLVPQDKVGYRVAFLEAFRGRCIPLDGVRTYSVESACWKGPRHQPRGLSEAVRRLDLSWDLGADRRMAWEHSRSNAIVLHDWIVSSLSAEDGWPLGLNLERNKAGELIHKVEVHSVRPARRLAPDGSFATDLVVVITQKRHIEDGNFDFRGGCTLLIDLTRGQERVRYAVVKDLGSDRRVEAERAWRANGASGSLAALYFGDESHREPFAFTHLGH